MKKTTGSVPGGLRKLPCRVPTLKYSDIAVGDKDGEFYCDLIYKALPNPHLMSSQGLVGWWDRRNRYLNIRRIQNSRTILIAPSHHLNKDHLRTLMIRKDYGGFL